MPADIPNPRDSLALWLAEGKTLASWAADHDIPDRTARDWAKKPEFKAKVSQIRDEFVDSVVGEMKSDLKKARAKISSLIENADTDSVKLAAARAMIADMIALANHADQAKQLAELRAEVDALKSTTGGMDG